ncbi:hypothetical protein LCGC14_0385360 [marine sediment metagenome]|uniref:Uncharacterized protein n=1 Tax=marine sediment metagenome TaxID=412755 RepID=A0A0F9T741_9ZZZZ
MYQGVISLGYVDPTNGNEFSASAPLYVLGQRFFSIQGLLVCQLSLIGIPNLMAMDKAESELTLEEGDARTVKDLITAVARKTLTPYTNYEDYTVTYDSEDNVINSLKPKTAFQISENDNRLEKIKQLIGWTGNKMRMEADGNIHTFDPKSAVPFDYEYKFDVADEHTFLSKELRNRFVNPNKTIVKSYEGDDPQFSGNDTSATSNALFPKTETLRFRLVSNTEASNIASARIESHELDSDVGAVTVPMNVGQEVWDFIKVTDSRQGDSVTGNVRSLRRHVKVPLGGGRFIWDTSIRFGTVPGLAPILLGRGAGLGSNLAVSVQALIEAYNGLREDLYGDDQGEGGVLGLIRDLALHVDAHHDTFITKNLHSTDTAFMPVEE